MYQGCGILLGLELPRNSVYPGNPVLSISFAAQTQGPAVIMLAVRAAGYFRKRQPACRTKIEAWSSSNA